MRATIMGLMVLGGLGLFATPSRAQAFTNNINDPFFQYYAWFLPRQAAMAAQPRANDQINAVAAARADVAIAERQGLYDATSPFGLDQYDPSQPFRREAVRARTSATGITSTSLAHGQADRRYFGRTGGYMPTARFYVPGSSKVPQSRRNPGGMFGMPYVPRGNYNINNPVGR